MNDLRQPKGIPSGGQFAAHSHSEPALGLQPALNVDQAAAAYYPDPVNSIRAAGLTGSLQLLATTLVFHSADDDFTADISRDGQGGWEISNEAHTDIDDPAYALRSEGDSSTLGERLRDMMFDADCAHAFTLRDGGGALEFRGFTVSRDMNGHPVSNANFTDTETNDDFDVWFNHETGDLKAYWDNSGISCDEVDEVVRELVTDSALDAPEGSPADRLKWHLERSFRIAAAKPNSPEWTHAYRVAGLGWEDRS